jgi:hypothetical protein
MALPFYRNLRGMSSLCGTCVCPEFLQCQAAYSSFEGSPPAKPCRRKRWARTARPKCPYRKFFSNSMGFYKYTGFARPPAWLHEKIMGLKGYEGFNCTVYSLTGTKYGNDPIIITDGWVALFIITRFCALSLPNTAVFTRLEMCDLIWRANCMQ